jgi:hypothetical protein
LRYKTPRRFFEENGNTRLRDRAKVLLGWILRLLARHLRRVVVDDLPLAMHQTPHVREARQNRLAIVFGAGHEGVHAGVEVHVRAEALHRI